MVITAPVQADTTFSKEEEVFAIDILGVAFSKWSMLSSTFEEDISLISFFKIDTKKREEKNNN